MLAEQKKHYLMIVVKFEKSFGKWQDANFTYTYPYNIQLTELFCVFLQNLVHSNFDTMSRWYQELKPRLTIVINKRKLF
jgi:hypothetical protein